MRVIAVGKIKDKQLEGLLADYQKRIKAFCSLEIVEIAEQADNNDKERAIALESQAIRDRIKSKEYVVLLDLQGQMLDSLDLADKLDKWLVNNSKLCFVIGGSNGVDEILKERVDYLWKLSDLTFPHQLVRLLLLEQLYRCFKINNKHKYHK